MKEVENKDKLEEDTAQISDQILQIKNALLNMCSMLHVSLNKVYNVFSVCGTIVICMFHYRKVFKRRDQGLEG